MPFTKMNRPPGLNTLLKPEGLVFLPADQLAEQREYWRGVERLGGFLQMQLGAVFLATLDHAELFRESMEFPPEKRPQPHSDIMGRVSLAGLALAHFMRLSYLEEVEAGLFETNPSGPGMDFDMTPDRQVAVMHHPKDTVEELLPGFVHGPATQYYEDPLLVVRASAPATPSVTFVGQYEEIANGRPFNAAAHVTLTPLLKVDFVIPRE